MRLTSTDDVELEVHDLGGHGPPLLLCHATGFHGLVWRPLAEHLRDRFSLWSLDFRGHGGSSAPDPSRGFAWEGFGEDVATVVDGLGLERPFGVGHSKGGAALLLAEAARPGTFAALWCYEPIVFPPGSRPDSDEDSALAAGAARRRATFPSRQAAVDNYAAKPPLAVLHPEALAAYVEHGFGDEADGTVSLRCRPTDEAQVYRMGGSHPGWDRLVDVACPTTVACGGPGATITEELAGRLVERLPHGRVEVFAELGHFGPLEDPARVADAIRSDLAGGPPSSGEPVVDEPVVDEPVEEHPVVDAAVEALGGTPESIERPAESPVQPVLPPGLAGVVARFDQRADEAFAGLRASPVANRIFYSASALGDFSLLWHLIGTARALRSPTDERAALRLAASLLGESVLVNGVVKSFFRRERPVWDQERTHVIRKPRSSSFPSGHATSGFMAATLLADGRSAGRPLWYGLASVVAASRVHVRIHHGSDVVAGTLIGLGLGAAVRRLWPITRP